MSDNNSIVKDIKNIIDNTAKTYEIVGNTYTNSPLHLVRHKDTAKTLVFYDLSSIVSILKNELKQFELPIYIIVGSYNKVCVVTSLDGEKEREVPYEVTCDNSPFNFGRMYDYEDFVIALRSMFVQNTESEDLLKLLKTITNSNSVEVEDDGITQKVTASKGVLTANPTKAAPIRRLAPYRTFTEIEQPTSEFLFRIRNNDTFSLFEADGGAWKRQAVENIKAFYTNAFEKEIADGQVIIVG